MSFLQSIKDTKRRVLQNFAASSNPDAKTVDVEYDTLYANYLELHKGATEVSSTINLVLMGLNKLVTDADLASSNVYTYYDTNSTKDWSNQAVVNSLKLASIADKYRTAWRKINSGIRYATAIVCTENGIEPFRSAIQNSNNSIVARDKTRTDEVTDYDSYRRRVATNEKTYQQQLEKGERTPGGPSLSEQKSIEATLMEINKFRAKMQTAKEKLDSDTARLKDDIISCKRTSEDNMDNLLITLLVCQCDMFTAIGSDLQAIVAGLPQEKVNEVRRNITRVGSSGGGSVAAPPPPAGMSAVFKGWGGGAAAPPPPAQTTAVSASRPPSMQPPAPPSFSAPAPSVSANDNKFSTFGGSSPPKQATASVVSPPVVVAPAPEPAAPVNAFASAIAGGAARMAAKSSQPAAAPAPAPVRASTSAPPVQGKYRVVALYDHVPDDADELAFKVNQHVDVLDDSDEGWWYGVCVETGAKGLFPLNYVQKM